MRGLTTSFVITVTGFVHYREGDTIRVIPEGLVNGIVFEGKQPNPRRKSPIIGIAA